MKLLSPFLTDKTATGLYNSATEKCCMGSVYPLVSGESCCGQKTIKTDSSICCDHKEANVGQEVLPFAKCCGEKSYDTRKETCCNDGANFHVGEGKNKSCCGDKAYDESKETCCEDLKNGTVVSHYVLPVDGKKRSCCTNSVFDPTTETCCHGKVAPGLLRCCESGQTYNISTHFCIKRKVVEINGINLGACYHHGYFDKNKDICCYDFGDGKGRIDIVAKKRPSHSGCCGSETYDRNTHYCCFLSTILLPKVSKLHMSCCGAKLYDPARELCCDGTLYLKQNTTFKKCCGNKPMNKRNKICCGEKIIKNSKSCCGESEGYDAATHLCCETYTVINDQEWNKKWAFSIFKKSNDTTRCCGTQLYDFEKELCCERKILPKKRNTQCCGSKSYDVDKEVCCGESSVLAKESGRDSCCLYGTTDKPIDYPKPPIVYH